MNKALGFGSLAMAALALGVAFFGGKEPPPAAPPAAASVRSDADFRELERRVALLEEDNGQLQRKVFELSRTRAVVLADGGMVAVAALPPMDETAHGAPGSPGLPAPPISPAAREELKEAARAAQLELENERRQERMARFEAEQTRQQAEQAEKWKKFTTEANLNGAQEQALKTSLDAEAARRKALMDAVRSGEKSFFEIRGEMRDTRQQTDAAMSAVLTPDQLKKYTEVRQSERREGGRGGGGWGAPGGGGNGDRGGPGGAWPR